MMKRPLVKGREKLLEQPFFMGLERVEFSGLQDDEFVDGVEAVGDFLLFFDCWNEHCKVFKVVGFDLSCTYTGLVYRNS